MTKRSVEQVLRDELEARRAEYGKAIDKREEARKALADAKERLEYTDGKVFLAKLGTDRAVAAIEAYTGTTLGLVETTIVATEAVATIEETTDQVETEVVSPKRRAS